jgi:hypothetical protein
MPIFGSQFTEVALESATSLSTEVSSVHHQNSVLGINKATHDERVCKQCETFTLSLDGHL